MFDWSKSSRACGSMARFLMSGSALLEATFRKVDRRYVVAEPEERWASGRMEDSRSCSQQNS